MNKEETIERGKAAEQLMRKGGLMDEAFREVGNRYTEEWRKADTPERREKLHQAVVILDKVKGHLKSVIGSGKLAQAEIEALEGRKRRRLPRFGPRLVG